MPYLTPEEIPESTTCRALLIPASSDWLAIVSGALTELVKTWNWAQEGSVTVAEAVAAMESMVAAYYDDPCASCELPGGYPVFRLGSDGRVEQLVDGEWVPPEGEYEIPTTPARTEPDPEDRRCLAAANAANVLEQLYESLADSYDEDKTLEEAVGVMIGLLATYFFWAAPIAAGLALLSLAAMEIVYLLIEIFGADLWDADFTETLKCILYECSLTDESEVVTFDYLCVSERLNSTLSHIDLNAEQLRLLAQLSYILSIIGGADALNAAGATTEIEEAVCSDCNDDWCFTFDLTLTNAGASAYTENGCTATYDSGVGWKATLGSGCAGAGGVSVLAAINMSFASTYIRRVVVVGTSSGRSNGVACAVAFPAINRGGTPSVTCVDITNGDPLGTELIVNGNLTGITAEFQNAAPSGVVAATGTAIIEQVTFYGNGECPFGIPNCLE